VHTRGSLPASFDLHCMLMHKHVTSSIES
jgi:hypothetical protein